MHALVYGASGALIAERLMAVVIMKASLLLHEERGRS